MQKSLPVLLGKELEGDASGKANADPYHDVITNAGGQSAIDAHKDTSVRVQGQVEAMYQKYNYMGNEKWQQDLILQCLDFGDLTNRAKNVKGVFDKVLTKLLKMLNEEEDVKAHSLAGVKGPERGKKKCKVKYGGDCSQMSDMVRGTIIVDGDINDLYTALDKVVSSKFLSKRTAYMTHFADRYQRPLGSYRDLMTLICIDGMVCELQFNLKAVLDIKESPVGHGQYESVRLANDDLLVACMNNNMNLAKDALSRGAKPKWLAESRHRISALHFASYHGNVELMEALLTHHGNPYWTDNMGMLPVHRCILNRDIRMVQALLQYMTKEALLESLDKHSGPVFMFCVEMVHEIRTFEEESDSQWKEVDTFFTGVADAGLHHKVPQVHLSALQTLDRLGYPYNCSWQVKSKQARKLLLDPEAKKEVKADAAAALAVLFGTEDNQEAAWLYQKSLARQAMVPVLAIDDIAEVTKDSYGKIGIKHPDRVQDLAKLATLMNSRSAEDRADVLIKLEELGEDAAVYVPEIIKKLSDADLAGQGYNRVPVAQKAANLLGQIGAPSAIAVSGLLEQMKDTNFFYSLQGSGGPVRKAMVTAIADVGKAVGMAAGEKGTRQTLFDENKTLFGTLLDSLPGIFEALQTEDAEDVRVLLVSALKSIGEEAVPFLAKALTVSTDNGDGAIRCACITALGEFGDKAREEVPDLDKLLEEMNLEARLKKVGGKGKLKLVGPSSLLDQGFGEKYLCLGYDELENKDKFWQGPNLCLYFGDRETTFIMNPGEKQSQTAENLDMKIGFYFCVEIPIQGGGLVEHFGEHQARIVGCLDDKIGLHYHPNAFGIWTAQTESGGISLRCLGGGVDKQKENWYIGILGGEPCMVENASDAAVWQLIEEE